MYAVLGESIGKLESSLYNFAFGTIILGVALLFWGKGKLSYTVKAPKCQLTGETSRDNLSNHSCCRDSVNWCGASCHFRR